MSIFLEGSTSTQYFLSVICHEFMKTQGELNAFIKFMLDTTLDPLYDKRIEKTSTSVLQTVNNWNIYIFRHCWGVIFNFYNCLIFIFILKFTLVLILLFKKHFETKFSSRKSRFHGKKRLPCIHCRRLMSSNSAILIASKSKRKV